MRDVLPRKSQTLVLAMLKDSRKPSMINPIRDLTSERFQVLTICFFSPGLEVDSFFSSALFFEHESFFVNFHFKIAEKVFKWEEYCRMSSAFFNN